MYCFTAFLPIYGSKMCRNCAQLPGSCTAVVPSAFISFAWRFIFLRAPPLHSQLHLRILFEDLRVALTKQLRDPLVRHAPGTQPRGIPWIEDRRFESKEPSLFSRSVAKPFAEYVDSRRTFLTRKKIITVSRDRHLQRASCRSPVEAKKLHH